MKRNVLMMGAFGALVCLSAVAPVRADRAIVVGVNEYPELTQKANLRGCVRDAQAMTSALKRYGFQVTMLTNSFASKRGIMAALRQARSQSRPGERFAFYFAGHGTRATDSQSVLLPGDANETSESNDIGADELSSAIRAIPASSRTVILDACFSEGMMRSLNRAKGSKVLRTRFYQRKSVQASKSRQLRGRGVRGSKSLQVVTVIPSANDNDSTNYISGGSTGSSQICYFTASRRNEQAGEGMLGGAEHGVFTYYLTNQLQGNSVLWNDLQTSVTAAVADFMEDAQHPMLTVAFFNQPVFGGPVTAAVKQDRYDTLWEIYNSDRINDGKVDLRVTPNRTTIETGDNLNFEVRVGTSGYLIVLERDTDGMVRPLFPTSTDADDAKVFAGQLVSLPGEGKAYSPDKPGVERVRALLISSKQTAQSLLQNFGGSRGLTRAAMRSLQVVDSKNYYTSDSTLEVK